MLDHRGFIAETNATHIFLVSGGVLHTPSTVACPEGITRQAVLDLAASADLPCAVGDCSLTQLYCADEIFVTGTMGGLAPVVAVDGRQIGDGKPGQLTALLMDLYAKLTATTGSQVC
jgi:branched-chain amino acid aminotransferase